MVIGVSVVALIVGFLSSFQNAVGFVVLVCGLIYIDSTKF